MTIDSLLASPGIPPPLGRVGKWLFALHTRSYLGNLMRGPRVAELADARTRRVDMRLNDVTTITFTVPGTSPTAAEIAELAQDVVCWRWDGISGLDKLVAQGTITSSQDTISEQAHTTNFICQDVRAHMKRRILTAKASYTQSDQDQIVNALLVKANSVTTSTGVSLGQAAMLNLVINRCLPDGTTRGDSGMKRDRVYDPQQVIYEAIDNLSQVEGGFDWDVTPTTSAWLVNIYYPYQGVQNESFRLEYGDTVSGVTRNLGSQNYANYVRFSGQAPSTGAAPYGEAWSTDATDLVSNPNGLWMRGESASDVTVKATLVEKANGSLAEHGAMLAEGAHGTRVPLPTYTVKMRPGSWYHNAVKLGDTVNLVIRSGRLNLSEWVRIVGITYDIGDDGEEDVALTLGTPAKNFIDYMTTAARRVAALERRTY